MFVEVDIPVVEEPLVEEPIIDPLIEVLERMQQAVREGRWIKGKVHVGHRHCTLGLVEEALWR